ncbi:efflux RND transporter permease subunit [Telmatospirillum sp.]|uniref:efflux RND transporter permease subunit n=1 Tax=Telmatospirillum sp. TaxID=2079197 RepID=UPI0028443556|nr:efflux RND transporter permease subunit [Telmatospirillum sp.]MDR3437474.1 efflux RND transporter permease subunit [Telmatospirillum sp.]
MTGFNLSDWALRHRSFVIYLMILCGVAGAFSFNELGRDEDPPFTIKTMVVKTLWPGATVDETVNQVTDRIEKKLEETPSLDYLRSYTTAGSSVIFVTLKDSTAPAAVADIWYQVRKKTGDIAYTLPSGTQGPFFDDEFGDTFGVIYAFTGDGFNYRDLKDYVESVRADLLRLPDVGKITLIGVQDEQVTIAFSTRKLASLGVTQAQVLQALQEQNAVAPSGVVDTGREKILLRVTGGFASEADVSDINLRINGRFFRLADVATIQRGFVDPPTSSYRVNGQPAIGLALAMAKGGDNLRLGDNIRKRMAEMERDRPIGIEVVQVANQPEVVRASVHGFVKSLEEAVAIVLVVSFLSLGFRAGTVVALSIPLVLAATFVGMKFCGIDLHRVSLGSLIIALGLLVDDAMITIEMMVKKQEEGLPLREAATFAFTSTAFPMLTGTLVTVIGFVPVGFAESASGEYCFSLFAVITIALLISWGVAVLFSPLIGVALLGKRVSVHKSGGVGVRVSNAFRAVLTAGLARRWWVIGSTATLFVVSLVATTHLEQQFFPSSDRPELLVDLTLPHNTSIRATGEAVALLEKRLAADGDVASYAVNVGSGAVRFYLPLDVQLDHDFFAEAVVVAKSVGLRDALAARLQNQLEEDLPDAIVRASPLELGPPVGWPLKYRVSGADPQRVRQAAYDLSAVLGGNVAVRSINFDWNEPIKTVRLKIDQNKARLVGLSSQDLAQALQATFSGTTITELRDSIYLIPVQTRAPIDERTDLDTLRRLQIPVGEGRNVPLGELAQLDYGFEQPIIWRRQRLPTLTIQADVAPGIQAATVVAQLAPRISAFEATLPAGYSVATGGSVEEGAKGMSSVAAVLPVMVLLMLSVLMVQLQSFQRMILVISVAPLGLIGVVAALLPTHTPMGFVAILGCVALIGMIVRNSVILIDQIERNIAAGMDRWDAVVEATCHRLRPILLTASAAILAMIPISSESFWGPMAFAIMGGLVVATLLTLLFLPAAYVAWFRIPTPAQFRPR